MESSSVNVIETMAEAMLPDCPATEALSYMEIKVVTDADACDEVIADILRRNNHSAVGFDCEWVNRKGRRPVALLQLSTHDGLCALFRLCVMKAVPQSLKDFLEDETIYKLGITPRSDGHYLLKDYSVAVKSTLDLRHLAELCGYPPRGLEKLSQSVLHIILNKNYKISSSNWELRSLSEKQMFYAAADSHVAIKVFVRLVNEYGRGPQFAELYSGDDVWSKLDEVCGKYVNVNFFDPLSMIFGKRNEDKNIMIRGLSEEENENLPVRIQTIIKNTLDMDICETEIKTLRLKSGDVVAKFPDIQTKNEILERSSLFEEIRLFKFYSKKTLNKMKKNRMLNKYNEVKK